MRYSWQLPLFQDGVDADAIFDSADLDARSQRADSLERAWGRLCANYQQSMDLEGVSDVVPQVTWPQVVLGALLILQSANTS